MKDAIMAALPKEFEDDERADAERIIDACILALDLENDWSAEIRDLLGGATVGAADWFVGIEIAIQDAAIRNEAHRMLMMGALHMTKAFYSDIAGWNKPRWPDIREAANAIEEFAGVRWNKGRSTAEMYAAPVLPEMPASLFLSAFRLADHLDDEGREALLKRVQDGISRRMAGEDREWRERLRRVREENAATAKGQALQPPGEKENF